MPKLFSSESTAKRILRAVRRVEQEPKRRTRVRRRVLPPAPGATDKVLYLPLEDTDNYLLPQDIVTGCYGYEWTPHATNLTNIDTTEQLDIVDYFGSIALPGQKLLCRYSATFEAYLPYPFGQNAIQLVRCYKNIEANSITDGSNLWFTGFAGGSLLNDDVVQVSECLNDDVLFDWCHSDEDIVADEASPVQLKLKLFHENGGCQWRIISRSCPV